MARWLDGTVMARWLVLALAVLTAACATAPSGALPYEDESREALRSIIGDEPALCTLVGQWSLCCALVTEPESSVTCCCACNANGCDCSCGPGVDDGWTAWVAP